MDWCYSVQLIRNLSAVWSSLCHQHGIVAFLLLAICFFNLSIGTDFALRKYTLMLTTSRSPSPLSTPCTTLPNLMTELRSNSMGVAYMRSWNFRNAMSNKDMGLVWSWEYTRWVNPPLCLVEATRHSVTRVALSYLRTESLFSLNVTRDWRDT